MGLYNKVIDLQKLYQAWEKVRRNKPAAGVDNVTYDQFETGKREELKQLNMELRNHSYHALPVRRAVIYKGEKAREIALYAMRDKVVQQSLAAELYKLYDHRFPKQVYAYRSSKSSLHAVNDIEEEIRTKKYTWALKVDIAHFFDEIDWEILKKILENGIREKDVLFLIEENVKTAMLGDAGELTEKRRGIYQGSGISSILSNIYMMEFDHWISKEASYYIRYSDDMLLLGKDQKSLQDILGEIEKRLLAIGLRVNPSKTCCVSLENGIDVLGYHFSLNGKSVPVKAVQNLQERLESMWLTSGKTLDEKMKKAVEIIGGWQQYFREGRKVNSIFEYLALVYAAHGQEDYRAELEQRRMDVTNIYKDIAIYLADIWKQFERKQMELLEYEQYYQIWEQKAPLADKGIDSLLENYRKLLVHEDMDCMIEIMQLYTDRHEYGKASFWMKKCEQIQQPRQDNADGALLQISKEEPASSVYSQVSAQKIWQLFVGREDVFCEDTMGYGGKRRMEMCPIPLTEKKITEHLNGDITVGTYIQRQNNTVKYLVVDVDISKKIMLQLQRGDATFGSYLENAWQCALAVKNTLKKFGLNSYIEYSGCRGYHVWIFFTEWIPVRYVNMLSDILDKEFARKEQDGISIEFFPNKTRVKADKPGQAMKIPYGYHISTRERSYFLDDAGNSVADVNQFLDGLAFHTLNEVKKILARNTGVEESSEKKVDENLDVFGELEEGIQEILKKCNLIRYLCQKSVKTGYLSHTERLSVLYVFGHLGDAGHEFVHVIMSHTLNYKYMTTERFIQKILAKPISCIKLREQYKQITAEYGCNCIFRRNKNCYPSPVLHALALANHINADITLPTSRTLSKASEQKTMDEINIHKKAQELALKILEMKKQKRGIDAAIIKVEKELEKIYDHAGVDCLEVEMGMLVRRKIENGYEWLIEI